MDALLRDLRHAVRSLVKSPGFSLAVILTLAIGIGANAAIFTLVKSALIRSLPYGDPDRLMRVFTTTAQGGRHEASYPDYFDFRKDNTVFSDVGGFVSGISGTLSGPEGAEAVRLGRATAGFFPTLGVTPRLGRAFTPEEELPEAEGVALLSDAIFTRRFGGDPALLGKTILVNGRPRTVVGVLPKGFHFAPGGGAEIWIALRPSQSESARRNYWFLNVVARLRPDVSFRQASAAIKAQADGLERAYPASNAGLSAALEPLRDEILGPIRPILLALMAAVGFVLLIACTNVTNLLLVRAVARRKELAIRQALGASGRQLVRPVLVESAVLGLAGGAVGLVVSSLAVPLLLAAIPESQRGLMPYLSDLSVDGGVLFFTFCLSLAAGLLFGLGSAPRGSRVSVLEDLGRSAPARWGARNRAVLVVAQMALAVVLLAGAGLMVRSTLTLLRQDPGFEASGLLTARVTAPPKESDAARIRGFHKRVLQTARSLPGVTGASTVDILPLGGEGGTSRFEIEGRPPALPTAPNEVEARTVSPGYFRDMGIPVRGGRAFDARDHEKAAPVLIVNEAFARRYFQGPSAVGQRLRFTYEAKQPFREIVGVVGDERVSEIVTPPAPVLYGPFDQDPSSPFLAVVRTSSDPEALAAPLTRALRALDRDLLVSEVRPMRRVIDDSPASFSRRYPALVLGAFATMALFLAVLGIHGVISYSVLQRRQEIGVRVAIGARPKDVVRLVLGEGFGLAARGLALGLLAALGLTQILRSLLFGVRPGDPATFAAIALIFFSAALLACYLPARRAARVDPVVALRCD